LVRGTVLRLWVTDTTPHKFKWLIVVAEAVDTFATVYINTEPRYQLPTGLSVSQLAINSIDCPLLLHDSFVDCSKLREKTRREIERALKQDPKIFKGIIPAPILNQIMVLIRHEESIKEKQKNKYDLNK
jgi:hypothetical protein